MATNYQQDGDVIDYVAGATISSGDVVVINNLLGVALTDGVSGDTIPVAIEGVWVLPKVTGAVIAQGETINWDVSAGNVDDNLAIPAAGDLSGGCIAYEAAGSGVLEIAVSLNVGVNTVT